MRALRTFLSAIAIIVGAACVVAWCVATLLLNAVDDGVVARTMVRAALATPSVTDRIGDEIATRTSDSLQNVGVDLTVVGADGAVRDTLVEWTRSEDFRETVLDQVDSAREQLRTELASTDRQEGPFYVSIEVSATVNEKLGDVPVVGSSIPDVTIAPVRVEVLSADSFAKARTTYTRLELVKHYCLWIGGALIIAGLAVSTRRRYVIAKFLIAVGVMALGVTLVLTLVNPEQIAARLPGGDQGGLGKIAVEALSDTALPGMRRTMAIVGSASLFAGALMVAVLKTLRGGRS